MAAVRGLPEAIVLKRVPYQRHRDVVVEFEVEASILGLVWADGHWVDIRSEQHAALLELALDCLRLACAVLVCLVYLAHDAIVILLLSVLVLLRSEVAVLFRLALLCVLHLLRELKRSKLTNRSSLDGRCRAVLHSVSAHHSVTLLLRRRLALLLTIERDRIFVFFLERFYIYLTSLAAASPGGAH